MSEMEPSFMESWEFRAGHLNKTYIIEGAVIEIKPHKIKIIKAVFECERCESRIILPQSPFDRDEIVKPFGCYKEQGGCGREKGSTKFKLMPNLCECIDYQEAIIAHLKNQDRLKIMVVGENVGKISIGEKVKLTGKLSIEILRRGTTITNYILHVQKIEARNGKG